jgi:hypothetical protein
MSGIHRLFVAANVWTSGRQRGIDEMEDSIRTLRAKPIDLMQVIPATSGVEHSAGQHRRRSGV